MKREMQGENKRPLLQDGRGQSKRSQSKKTRDGSGGWKERYKDFGTKYPVFTENAGKTFTVAGWVTVFFIPVCSPRLEKLIFTGGINIPHLLASPDLEAYWPNIVQFMFMCLGPNLGVTFQNCWQGFVGTMIANLNLFIMILVLPHGGQCEQLADHTYGSTPVAFGLRPTCDKYVDPNYAAWGWIVAWADVLFVMLLLLGTNCGLNVQCWCLNWHCLMMMAFMSPTGYPASHAIVITTLLG
jgi:hypothetical protein